MLDESIWENRSDNPIVMGICRCMETFHCRVSNKRISMTNERAVLDGEWQIHLYYEERSLLSELTAVVEYTSWDKGEVPIRKAVFRFEKDRAYAWSLDFTPILSRLKKETLLSIKSVGRLRELGFKVIAAHRYGLSLPLDNGDTIVVSAYYMEIYDRYRCNFSRPSKKGHNHDLLTLVVRGLQELYGVGGSMDLMSAIPERLREQVIKTEG